MDCEQLVAWEERFRLGAVQDLDQIARSGWCSPFPCPAAYAAASGLSEGTHLLDADSEDIHLAGHHCEEDAAADAEALAGTAFVWHRPSIVEEHAPSRKAAARADLAAAVEDSLAADMDRRTAVAEGVARRECQMQTHF